MICMLAHCVFELHLCSVKYEIVMQHDSEVSSLDYLSEFKTIQQDKDLPKFCI